MLGENWQDFKEGDPLYGQNGGYYLDDDNTRHNVLFSPYTGDGQYTNYETLDNFDDWEKAQERKGKSHWFAYKHNIGNYFNTDPNATDPEDIQDRIKNLGKTAHYDEDNFFWLQMHPNDVPVMAQLRVGNHRIDVNKWAESHSLKYEADFGLSIVIDRQPLTTHGQERSSARKKYYTDFRVGVLEVDMDWDNMPDEKKQYVEQFLKDVQDDKKPLLRYQDVLKYFCAPGTTPIYYGHQYSLSDKIRPRNLSVRQKIQQERPYQKRKREREEREAKEKEIAQKK